MSTYLVTGCAGFIGSKVAELLLQQGHAVVGVDNLNDAYDRRLKDWRLTQITHQPGFTFHHLDIADRAALAQLVTQRQLSGGPHIDAVLNLAARAGVRYSVENPWVYVEANVTGTLNLLELCRAQGIGKFILSSTSS